MSAGSLINQKDVPTGFGITAGVPSTFGDIMSAQYQAGLTNYNSNSEWDTLRGTLTENFEQYSAATGKQRFDLFPGKPAPVYGPPIGDMETYDRGYSSDPLRFEAYDAEIARLKAEDPSRYGHLKNFAEIQEAARAKSIKDKELLESAVYRAAPGTSVFGATLTGGVGAATQDPINIATSLVGAGASASLVKTFLVEAAINMAAEGAIQPFVADYQRKLGQEYTDKEMATHILAAGLLGGTFATVLRGGGRAMTRVLGNKEDIPVALRDEARHAENNHHTEDGNPAAAKDYDAHVKDYVRASQDMSAGKRVDLDRQSSVAYQRWLASVDKETKSMWDEVAGGADVDEVVNGRLLDSLMKWRSDIIDDPAYKTLSRAEVKALEAQIKEIEHTLAHPKKLSKAKDEIKKAYKGISGREAERIAKMEAVETAEGLKNLKQKLTDRIDDGREIKVLDGEIGAIKQGTIPKRHRGTVNEMKAGIKKLDEEYKAFDLPTVERQGDEIQQVLEENNIVPSRSVDNDLIEESIEHRGSPDYEAEMNAEFQRLLEANQDELIIDPDTGQRITLRELQDDIDASEREFSEITSCGVGK